jgi:hypothetical protein
MQSRLLLALTNARAARGAVLVRNALACIGASLLSCALSVAAVDSAGGKTIDTYEFTQGGYTAPGSLTGVLSGAFTGTVEPDGVMDLTGLSSISLAFEFDAGGTSTGVAASLFEFDMLLGPSGLNLIVPVTSGAPGLRPICVGQVAEIGFDGCGPGGVRGDFTLFPGVEFSTQDLPVLTLVSSVNVPEPATWMTVLIGFASLGAVGFRRTGKSPPCALMARSETTTQSGDRHGRQAHRLHDRLHLAVRQQGRRPRSQAEVSQWATPRATARGVG